MMQEPSITIERFDSTGAIGFVYRQDGDESVILRLVNQGDILAETTADLYRPDLVAQNLTAHPYCGFVLPVPIDKVVSAFRRTAIVRADGRFVAHGRMQQQPAVNELLITAEEILDLCPDMFYGVDSFAFVQGVLSVWGIAL